MNDYDDDIINEWLGIGKSYTQEDFIKAITKKLNYLCTPKFLTEQLDNKLVPSEWFSFKNVFDLKNRSEYRVTGAGVKDSCYVIVKYSYELDPDEARSLLIGNGGDLGGLFYNQKIRSVIEHNDNIIVGESRSNNLIDIYKDIIFEQSSSSYPDLAPGFGHLTLNIILKLNVKMEPNYRGTTDKAELTAAKDFLNPHYITEFNRKNSSFI